MLPSASRSTCLLLSTSSIASAGPSPSSALAFRKIIRPIFLAGDASSLRGGCGRLVSVNGCGLDDYDPSGYGLGGYCGRAYYN